MPKVVLEGYITVPATDWAAVASELSNHIELTRSEAGCLVFEVHPDGNTPGLYHVYEEFTDQCAFRAHQDRVRSSAWGEVTKNVQRHYDIRECES